MDRLTIPEYNLLMKSVELKHVDEEYRLHKQAFLNLAAQAQKKAGKEKNKTCIYKLFQILRLQERS